ncbi:hypothetical protein Q3G72_033103 [Acer saccharum]|nr:hypothetical protein Q3G72_033103 [Acer saccharum]
MDLVRPVLYVFNLVRDCIVRHSYPIRHLRENLQSLEEAKRELEAISRDVESNVSQLEEQQHSRRTNEVQNWLETVDRTLKEVEDTLQRRDQEIKKRGSDLVRFPNNFFRSMCALIVLDLSGNVNLIELPAEIGELVNLQYLNVSFTSIKTLPIEVKKLRLLRILRFEDMLDFQNIPAGVLSCLSSLQMFCWFSYSSVEAYHVDISLLQELEGLEHIKDISLMLSSIDCIDKLFSSPKLKACVASLRIGALKSVPLLSLTYHLQP